MLTKRQNEVLEYIVAHWQEGTTPTMRELSSDLGFASLNNVHIRALRKKGYLVPSGPLELTDKGRQGYEGAECCCPHCGHPIDWE